MPFSRPVLPTLINRAEADIESKLTGADARLRRSNLNVMARVHAGGVHGLYGYLDWLAKQILPDTADDDILERHAQIWLEGGRLGAGYATGQATVTGTNGKVIEALTAFKRADGVVYHTESEVVISAGETVVSLIADVAGQDGNAAAGITLTLDSPIDGINASALVTSSALTGGADIEDIEALRTRLIDRIQKPPQGGSKNDYVSWAKETPGVTRAWCFPEEMGDGTVTVRFVRDDDASLIPDVNEVATVQAAIEAVAPVNAHLYVVAPIAAPLVFQIRLVPALAAVKAAVEAGLRDLLLREAEPEGGAAEGKVLLSHIREAISLAAGETDHVLLAPVADVAPTIGQMVTFGSITWVP